MSNQQWPGQPGQQPGQSPWSQPDPRWQPQSYHDVQGRDPRQPFGHPHGQPGAPGHQVPYGQRPPSASIDEFQAPRSSVAKPLMIGLAIVGAIGILLVALQFFGGEPTASPSPTVASTPSGSPDTLPTAVATSGTTIPFEGNGEGTFEVLSQNWTDNGLVVEIKVSLNPGQGTESFTTYAFNNESMQVVDPTDTTPFTASEDQPYTGSFTFTLPEGKATLVLASGAGRALTALPIRG